MAVADPRSGVRFRGIGQINATFPIDNSTIVYDVTKKGGCVGVGLAVSINSSGQLILATDGSVIIGKLLRVQADNFATVQIFGAAFMPPGASQTLVPGNSIVGALGAASAQGYVRAIGLPATGSIGMASQPTAADTVTVNGVVLTAVSSIGATAGNFLIGASAAATLKNLLAALQNNGTGVGVGYIALTTANQFIVGAATYTLNAAGTAIIVTYGTVGTQGNAFTLAKSSTVITVSGATLTGATNGAALDGTYQVGVVYDTGAVNDEINGAQVACYTVFLNG